MRTNPRNSSTNFRKWYVTPNNAPSTVFCQLGQIGLRAASLVDKDEVSEPDQLLPQQAMEEKSATLLSIKSIATLNHAQLTVKSAHGLNGDRVTKHAVEESKNVQEPLLLTQPTVELNAHTDMRPNHATLNHVQLIAFFLSGLLSVHVTRHVVVVSKSELERSL